MKIAICGKGGVGKTTVSAFLIQALAEKGRKVLAIDSDPSPHLARLLGFQEAEKITPIAEMQDLLLERSERDGPFYKLNPKVDDLPEKFMVHKGSIRLMVLGAIREGGAGCACADNAVLKALLNTLLLSQNEDIVVDMEAGVEPLGRGTIAPVDHLLIVVQPYMGSLETAKKILRLAKDLKRFQTGIIANLVSSEGDIQYIEENLGIKPIGIFYQSDNIKIAEREKIPVYEASKEFKDSALSLIQALGIGI